MAGTFLGKYDTTAANNSATGTSSVSVAEGMLPSNINNAFRDVMADIRQHYNNAEWIEYGDGAGTYSPAYASSTSFRIDGSNVSSVYHIGRRVKVTASTPGTIYGTITGVAFSGNTTVTVAWDSGSLSDEAITNVFIGVLSKTNNSIPTGIDATKLADGTISNTELQYLNGVSSAIQTQLDAKQATITGSATTIDTESLTANRAVISNGSQKIAVSDVTSTELGYLDGVSSAIQTQIDTKATTSYVNDAVAGLRTRIVVEAATTANIDLTADLQNGDTIDGVTLATGDEVLVKNQSTDSQNGIYTVVSSGTANRSTEYDSIDELSGQMVIVNQGTANDNKFFLCSTNSNASLGSDSITFTQVTPQNSGTVTSIATGTGINGGTITSTGTLSIDSTVATLTGTQTLTNKTLTSPKIGTSVLDTNGNELLKLTATSSAINEITLANAAASGTPTLTATGGDTNIGVSILPKGSGQVTIDNLTFPAADGSANQILTTNGSGALSFVDNSGGTAWQSAVKTSNFTAAAGEGYFINTAGGAFEVDLPGSASVGDEIEFVDFTRNFGTAALTLDQGSLKFQGNATSPKPVYDTDGQSIKIVYSGSVQGWIPVRDDDVTMETRQTYTVDFLCIAGGGGGGSDRGGGGGAGGYRNSFASETSGGGASSETALELVPGNQYTVTVGGVGAGAGVPNQKGTNGVDSSIAGTGITTLTSAGGGGGGSGFSAPLTTGIAGGSGGGGAANAAPGAGTSGQGFAAEAANPTGSAGGGAGEAGGTDAAAFGGDGLASAITGSSVNRGGGGGANRDGTDGGDAGDGGGGKGGQTNPGGNALNGSVNTGGGGGGGGGNSPQRNGGNGGTGVVILSMADADYTGTTTGSPTVATGVSGKTVLTFNASGSYTA
jgi:hypothetical protein